MLTPENTDEAAKKVIGARLAEERVRLGVHTQDELCARTGLKKRTVAGWEIGEGAPKHDSLGALLTVGVDVLYVLTGRRGGALAAEESRLVTLYLRIPIEKRPALMAMAEALASSVPPPAPSVVTQTFHGSVGSIHAVHQGTMHNRYAAAARPVPVKKRAK